jgi:hypothetical protein
MRRMLGNSTVRFARLGLVVGEVLYWSLVSLAIWLCAGILPSQVLGVAFVCWTVRPVREMLWWPGIFVGRALGWGVILIAEGYGWV